MELKLHFFIYDVGRPTLCSRLALSGLALSTAYLSLSFSFSLLLAPRRLRHASPLRRHERVIELPLRVRATDVDLAR